MTLMWTSLDEQNGQPTQSPLDSTETPEYVAVDLNRTVYDMTGAVTQQLTADKMTYYKSQNRAEFESPTLTMKSNENNHKWRISSGSGILYNNDRLLLEQDVNATNLTESEPINTISGQNIRVNIKQNTLVSEQPVNITGDDVIMTGSGMTADLDKQQIELLKHAETIYDINRR